MKSQVVQTQDGTRWKVSVRMLPWRPRFRWPWSIGRSKQRAEPRPDRTLNEPVVADAIFFDELFLIGIVVLIALAILPTFIFLVEVLILAVAMLVTILVRVLFRQPWIVDAIADDGAHKAWKVTGYRASRRAVPEIAAQLARGTQAPIARSATMVR